jgi:hypothetical protein
MPLLTTQSVTESERKGRTVEAKMFKNGSTHESEKTDEGATYSNGAEDGSVTAGVTSRGKIVGTKSGDDSKG